MSKNERLQEKKNLFCFALFNRILFFENDILHDSVEFQDPRTSLE